MSKINVQQHLLSNVYNFPLNSIESSVQYSEMVGALTVYWLGFVLSAYRGTLTDIAPEFESTWK